MNTLTLEIIAGVVVAVLFALVLFYPPKDKRS